MDTILEEIRRAFGSGCFYLAITSSLTVPDICSALEAQSGRTTSSAYQRWCTEWFLRLGHYDQHLTAADLWNLRCGVVHQGRMGHPGLEFRRVIFSLPSGNLFDLNWLLDPADRNDPSKRCLNLDARNFCRAMVEAAQAWYSARRNDPNVQANLPNLLQYRPNGLLPWIDTSTACVS
jgi:hypothetical protein